MAATDAKSPARTDKRRSILDAAAPLFADEGYERASVDAIASSAGVSKPTVYAYFGNKEELFRETMADIARDVNAASYDAVISLDLHPDRWAASLRDVALALTNCQREGCAASLMRLVLAESRRDPLVYEQVRRAGFEPVLQAIAGRLAMLANAGFLEIDDPVEAAQHFVALTQYRVNELTVGGTVAGDSDQVAKVVDSGVTAFLRAYGVG